MRSMFDFIDQCEQHWPQKCMCLSTKTVQVMYLTIDHYKDFLVTHVDISVSMWDGGWPEDFHYEEYSVTFGHTTLITMTL